MNLSELKSLIVHHENENVEIKEWKDSIPFDGNGEFKNRKCLLGYCVALGNELGGKIIIGVRNNGEIIGTKAQINTNAVKKKIYDQTGQKIEIEEILDEDKKILIVHIPSRPIGKLLKFAGVPLMRIGESLEIMSDDEQRKFLLEGQDDFSAKICEDLSFQDLDATALDILQTKWAKKEQKEEYLNFSHEEVLDKLFLRRKGKLTFASLLLCGKYEKISELLPVAEIRFCWKNVETKQDFDFTRDWKIPFLKSLDELWEVIDVRNTRVPFEQGFFEGDILAFDQKSIREAILNAFAHRDYEARGPIFIEASSRGFVIKNPGKFLPGVSSENILESQGQWRNLLLMETLGKIGLVERYGHGLDRIFSKTISEGKGTPVIEELSTNYIRLMIPTQVKDKNFIIFLQRVEKEKQVDFDLVKDLVFLDEIREKQSSNNIEKRDKFLKSGIIEKIGKGRGMKYLLSNKFYDFLGEKGEYTRKKWLAKDQQKEVLWKFFQQHKKGRMKDFREGLFEGRLKNRQILELLELLRKENHIYFDGKQRSPVAYWKIKKLKE